ncbi:Nitrogen assimilation regulatory protein [Posidoniimonas polymericola]|uniref:DNA-binding transcriptional regulator NtrC n=1 Tax=Posidoniimonas polymericola TaxID=2528002 RepID=A0A5C5YIF4_9BACT|nr:sigma-54 dependent transcriptional regulator [Posidoniimonas polymericola]TWT74654.1 Nitrogen assimilation regulatory protein [Posidoniimonas polymericola]
MANLLVIDDESSICWGITRLGEGMGHRVTSASSVEQGLDAAAAEPPALIILDVRLPGQDGLSAMRSFRELCGDVPIVIITAFGDLQTAVRAVSQGAFEYVLKPFDLAQIRSVIERALRPAPQPASPKEEESAVAGVIGRSPRMQAVFHKIALAAHADAPVLLRGETGVGKEVAAQAIHHNGPRPDAPFVAVSVAALSPTVAEAELFGHVEGAFTGAQRTRRGLLAQADGGTLFLDEVAEIPLAIQAKLLRALDQGEVLPVGADQPVKTSFRTIAATHRDLRAMVHAGDFRQDLFYRLCAYEIELPPLRDRREDIALLAAHFARTRRPDASLSAEAIAELESRDWPGNVRELRNAIEHALLVSPAGDIFPEHLPPIEPKAADPAASRNLESALADRARELIADPEAAGQVYNRYLEQVEPPLLQAALDQHARQCAPAARALGLHRTTLRRKLDQLGVDADP